MKRTARDIEREIVYCIRRYAKPYPDYGIRKGIRPKDLLPKLDERYKKLKGKEKFSRDMFNRGMDALTQKGEGVVIKHILSHKNVIYELNEGKEREWALADFLNEFAGMKSTLDFYESMSSESEIKPDVDALREIWDNLRGLTDKFGCYVNTVLAEAKPE